MHLKNRVRNVLARMSFAMVFQPLIVRCRIIFYMLPDVIYHLLNHVIQDISLILRETTACYVDQKMKWVRKLAMELKF